MVLDEDWICQHDMPQKSLDLIQLLLSPHCCFHILPLSAVAPRDFLLAAEKSNLI